MVRNPEPESVAVFFEGAEKKVEFLVDSSIPSLLGRCDAFWSRVLAPCGAHVVSRIANRKCEAYLLSESSLFVYEHRVVLITCGQTNPLGAVFALLAELSTDRVEMLLYERKNEVFPHQQSSSFHDDVRVLHASYPGRAFLFGDEEAHHVQLFQLDRSGKADSRAPDCDESGLEILMYGVAPEVCELFRRGSRDGEERGIERSGVRELLSGYEIDDHVFEPAGYSLNGIAGDRYLTIHVTPQRIGSYASFETNHRFRDAAGLDACIRRVLDVFRPRAVDFVTFDTPLSVVPERHGLVVHRHVAAEIPCGYRVEFLSSYRREIESVRPVELDLDRSADLQRFDRESVT